MSGTVHLLVSPDAGRGRADGAHTAVVATLEATGHDIVDLTGPDAEASLTTARAAVADGASRIIVVGGDGLVHLALQAVAGTDTVLGVVPVGTGNDFVRGLGGFDPDGVDPAAAARAALGPSTGIDAIDTGRGWIASVATAGFSGDVNERANHLRFPRGASRYTVATMLELPRLGHRQVRLVVDGDVHEYECALLAVGNTAWFGGGMHICPGADPTDGLLDVTVVRDLGRIELLRFFRLVFSGRHLDHPKVDTHRGAEVRLDCDGLPLWGDGEPVDVAPITMHAISDAVRVAGIDARP